MPLTFARGRNGDVYGVNGYQRGLRWDGITASIEALGISAPASAPTISINYASPKYDLMQIDVVDGGFGYRTEPTVHIGGGGVEVANVVNGGSETFTVSAGHGLSVGNAIQFTSLGGSTEVFRNRVYYVVNVADSQNFKISATAGGAPISLTYSMGYAPHAPATLRRPSTTSAFGRASISNGRVISVSVDKHGSDYLAAPVADCGGPDLNVPMAGAASLSASLVTVFSADMAWQTVDAVTVQNGGSGYTGRPRIQFSGGNGGGAYAEADVDSSGAITSVTVLNGGQYETTPTVTAIGDWSETPRPASLSPVLRPGIKGKYWCAFRYIDDTVAAKGGPIPSSISALTEVEVTDPAGSLSWSFSTTGMETRVNKIELWRTTSDQVTVLYKVAELAKNVSAYTDTLSDAQLANPNRNGFAAMPIVLPNGQANARRFNPPPQNKAVIAMFQDRAWYAVDVPGRTWTSQNDANAAEPNTLYFSEADEPESVPEFNELIIQENVKGQDRITALMPFGGGMVVFQERHCYRLSFVSQPLIDANISLIGQRGCLNQRCWDVYDNVAYVVDSMGMYMLDGSNTVPLSDSVDTYWSENLIHFASSKWFFVRVDPATRIARFFFSVSAGYPDRALCFHPLTKAWWLEQYAQTFAAAECMTIGGRQNVVVGGQGGAFYKFDVGNEDVNSAGSNVGIACSIRTGNFPITDEPSRTVRLLYKPTSADCTLSLALHYNGAATARKAAVRTDRGTGFTTEGGADAALNLKSGRSSLGDATGYAVCSYAGRLDDRSAGGDRHLAINLSLTRPSSEGVTLYGAGIEGVGA